MLSNKYNRYILLNYCSLIIGGLCGFSIPVLVGIFYPLEGLGVFNQALSLYLIFSQVAAFGIHLSVLKYTAQHTEHAELQKIIISSGFFGTLIIALPCTLLIYFLRDFFALLFNSQAMAEAIIWVALGMFFTSLNKTLLFALNALERLNSYAFYTSIRYILLMLALAVLIVLDVPAPTLFAIFPTAESILCIILLYTLRKDIALSATKFATIFKHISFGLRAVGGHIMLQLNTRVDIICLGIFLDDAAVGIYSMAAILTEGACQLPTVLRTVYNPKIIQLLAKNDLTTLGTFSKKIRNITGLSMAVICAVSVALYPYIIPWITGNADYAQAQPQFAILMLGVAIASGYMPLGFLLINAGYPGRQTQMTLLILGCNILANIIFIPFWGLYGAAIGTCISYIVFVLLLRFFATKHLALKI